jgi:AraC-like DNA-binding protein
VTTLPAERVALDGDDFVVALPGVSGALVRTGAGRGPTLVSGGPCGTIDTALVEVGFPMVGEAAAATDTLVAVAVLDAGSGGCWDGIGLLEGQTFVYRPGASQLASDPTGLRFALVSIPWELVAEAFEVLDTVPESMPAVLGANPELFAAIDDVVHRGGANRGGADGAVIAVDRLVGAIAGHLSAPSVDSTRRRGWSSVDVVADALAAIEQLGDRPVPVLSLCRACGVSERRLQLAFQEVFGVGPHAYMRQRALHAAHRALLAADPGTASVTATAADHGFVHGGRFASYYRQTFGCTPRATLSMSA